MPKKKPTVAIVMGSKSDWPVLEYTYNTLKEFGIESTVNVMSAHRTPHEATEFAENAARNGYKNTAWSDSREAKSRKKRRSTQEKPSRGGRRTRSAISRRFSIIFGYLLTSFARRYRRFRSAPITADAQSTAARRRYTTIRRRAAGRLRRGHQGHRRRRRPVHLHAPDRRVHRGQRREEALQERQ